MIECAKVSGGFVDEALGSWIPLCTEPLQTPAACIEGRRWLQP